VEGESAPSESAAEEPSLEPVAPLLASADLANGEKLSKACAACHSFDKGGPNKVGPNLWNIVGAKHAHAEGFAYSDAIAAMADKPWSYEELNAFLAAPKVYAPGTKMGYAGMKKVEDRADLIAWLRSLSDSPQPLPSAADLASATEAASAEAPASTEAQPTETQEAETQEAATQEAAAPASAPAGDSAADPAILAMIATADPAAGEKLTRRCSACHSFDKGGEAKLGPNLYGVVGAPIGNAEGFDYSDGFKAKHDAGEAWSYQNLWAFLMAPKDWAPDTKMAFRGLGKEDELAAMIAYLKQQSDNPPPLQ